MNQDFLKSLFFKLLIPFFAFGPQNTYQNIRFENDDYYRQLQKDENKVAIFGVSVANNLFKLEELNDPKYFSEKLNLDIKEIKNFALKVLSTTTTVKYCKYLCSQL